MSGRHGPRKEPPARMHGLWPHEIVPGRSVVNDWDNELFESWADRKARLAAERGDHEPGPRL